MLLLHSFEYEDARESFLAAQQRDPGFAMAYWGEAMTFNGTLWGDQDLESARAALNRLAPSPEARLARCPTAREKSYMRAAEVLFGPGDKRSRDEAFSASLRQMTLEYPQDHEAASLYALTLLALAPRDDMAARIRAAAIAEDVFAQNPEHPGAIHYMIHAYDLPLLAPLGERAARVYARVAPAATHAQHMIAHIFFALGRWQEAAEADRMALRVSEERARRKGLPLHSRTHHSLQWLQYAYLQQGRLREARECLELMREDVRADPSPGNLWYYSFLRASYAVHAPRNAAIPPAIDSPDALLRGFGLDRFTDGLLALRNKDRAGAERALAVLRGRLASAGEAGTSGDTPEVPRDRLEVLGVEIMEKQLAALLLWEAGKKQEALALAREAVPAEEVRRLNAGPPAIVKPTAELLGEMLLEAGERAEAVERFQGMLERRPRRALSLLGLARAARAAGQADLARHTYLELQRVWGGADTDLVELREVRGYLAEEPAAGAANR